MQLSRHLTGILLLTIHALCWGADRNINDNGSWKNPALNQENARSISALAGQPYDPRLSDAIAESVLQFAHDVGLQLNENLQSASSEVFSPVSVMSALALLLLGAKGASHQELGHLFRLDTDPTLAVSFANFHAEFGKMIEDLQQLPNAVGARMRSKDNWRNTFVANNIRGTAKTDNQNKPVEHVVRVANGLFAQNGYSLNLDYKNVITSVYGSELIQLDFRTSDARELINAWVNSRTFGKIPTIITDRIPRDTNVIIASALYFKGFWENSFFERATILDDFYPDGLRQPPVKVQMMATGGAFPFYDSPEYGCRIIGLPYQGNLTTMYVIQPHDSSRAKLKALQAYLDAKKIEEMISKMVYQSAVVAFPKMHLVRGINMKRILNNLGLYNIFNKGRSDLSLIGDVPNNPVTAQAPTKSAPLLDRQPQNRSDRPAVFVFPGRSSRASREAVNLSGEQWLERLETQRRLLSNKPSDLFVEDILHKVDFDVNEQGTEAAAATLTYLKRSGTDVLFRAETPFLLLIRHDPTKLVLFYGIINIPQLA